jgi:hypothetical protein
MMKALKMLTLVASATLITFTACRKLANDPTEVTDLERQNGKDYSTTENLFSEAYNMVEMEAQKDATLSGFTRDMPLEVRGGCPMVTVTPTGNTFPKTVTLDFGTGCTTKAGRAASGKITAVFTGKIRQNGVSITTTFQDFTYKGYTLGGTHKVTYTSATTLTRQVTNGTITTPDGKNLTYSNNFTLTQTEGMATTFLTNGEAGILDDVYSILGGGTGNDGTGKTYTMTITTPLVKKLNCEWLTSGVAELKITGLATRKLDFGAGTCHNQATLTVGRFSAVVTLP